jgi:hypothetical protein
MLDSLLARMTDWANRPESDGTVPQLSDPAIAELAEWFDVQINATS